MTQQSIKNLVVVMACMTALLASACKKNVETKPKPVEAIAVPEISTVDAQISPYRAGKIDQSNLPWIITDSGEPGESGVIFTYHLNPSERYIISASGALRNGQVSTVIVKPDSEREYFSLPMALDKRIISGLDKLDIIIFGQDRFRYDLNSIKLNPCPKCLTDEERLSAIKTATGSRGKSSPSIRYYNRPDLVFAPDKASVSIGMSDTAAAGLFFDFTLDPSQKYRVKLAGEVESGSPTFRYQQDESPTQNARSETFDGAVISDTSKLEVLIYGGEPFAYRLDHIELQLCPKCKTDSDLIDRIHKEIPTLADLLKTDRYAAALEILNWASVNADYTNSSQIAEEYTRKVASLSPSQSFFDYYEKNAGGGYCGAHAVFSEKVLKLFGFDTFTVNFGIHNSDFTHVTTVVRNLFGDDKFYILDPTFNGYFIDQASGNLLSVDQLINAVPHTIQLIERPILERDYLITHDQKLSCPNIRDEVGLYLVCERPDFGFDEYLRNNASGMKPYGLSADIEGFIGMMKAGFMNVGRSESSEEFITMLRENNVPYELP